MNNFIHENAWMARRLCPDAHPLLEHPAITSLVACPRLSQTMSPTTLPVTTMPQMASHYQNGTWLELRGDQSRSALRSQGGSIQRAVRETDSSSDQGQYSLLD
jgi:hypothetical protein